MTAAIDNVRNSMVPLGLLLLVVVFLPLIVFYAGVTSSLALGATIAGAIVVLTVAAYPLGAGAALARAGAVFAGMILLLCAHLFVAGLLRTVDFAHALASFVPLLMIGLGGVALGVAAQSVAPWHFDRSVYGVLAALSIVAVLPSIGLDVSTVYPGNGYAKPIFPFTEPSHFALIFIPFYLYACVRARGGRRLALLSFGLALIFMLESLTLGAGWLIVALVCTRGLVLPVIVLALVAVVLTQLDLTYYLDRLDFSDASQNLSTLVYLQGWELMTEGLTTTNGWGNGFQQLGLQGTESPISEVIVLLAGNNLNLKDGGFALAKLVGELGVVGIGLIAVMMVAIARSIMILRENSWQPRAIAGPLVFAHAVFVAYLIDLLVRGTGYFTGSTLLLFTAVWLRSRNVRSRRVVPVLQSNAPLAIG